MPNQTTDVVSLANHCMAFANWGVSPISARHTLNEDTASEP